MQAACPLCPPEIGPQPIENFYVCRARRNQHTLYCRKHARAKIEAGRTQKREWIKLQRLRRSSQLSMLIPERKQSFMWIPRTPLEKVKDAISRGYNSRDEIKSETRLTWDEVTDSLAILKFEQGAIQFKRVAGEAMFFLKDVA